MTVSTILTQAIRDDYRTTGGHWFDADTLAWWNSQIAKTAYDDGNGHAYFVTSEQDKTGFGRLGHAWNGERRFSVRCYTWATHDISTIGEFGAYMTRKFADASAFRLALHGSGASVGV
jgi:hypothetical protein